jgi:hypothetical protein
LTVRLYTGDDAELAVRYAVDLAKKNSEALSFIPAPTILADARAGRLLIALENDEPCGFLIHGNGWPQMRIYQACIQYDARRLEHGKALVAALVAKSLAAGYTDIRLWCANDLDANAFWASAGFIARGSKVGGARRGRMLTLWVLPLQPPPLLARIGHREAMA